MVDALSEFDELVQCPDCGCLTKQTALRCPECGLFHYNLDELGGIDFKKGCYIGQENTSRIKLRNKLRKRILPIEKISGEIKENDIIKYKNNEIGKIMIDKPYTFGLIKVIEPNLDEFVNKELICGKSKIKILKPDWI